MSELEFIFCHGLSGWGEYDRQYKRRPYWGMQTGDLLKDLRNEGYRCHGASVAPTGSAWDRACELYAQIAGTRTDYGRSHSIKYRHERYGKDFTGMSLIENWNDDTRIVLIGHSFGGATIRLLAELLANGSEEEQNLTHPKDLSPLFKGGMGKRVFAIVTLAAPTNGTVSYDMNNDPDFDTKHVDLPLKYQVLSKIMSFSTKMQKDKRDPRDFAAYDMEIDHAMALNERIHLSKDTYYFSIACSSTILQEDGTHYPDLKKTEGMFVRTSVLVGKYKGVTSNGVVIDEKWRDNDGLVNTISARAPFNDPQRNLDPENIVKGQWNIFPDYQGDHASLQGGYTIQNDPRPFYKELLELISKLQ